MPDRDLPIDGTSNGGPALEALRAAVEGTARAWGEEFFPVLCAALCRALDVPHALIGEMTPDGKRAAVRAVCWNGRAGDPFIYDLAGTPCDKVLGAAESAFIPCGVAAAFPDDTALADRQIEAYIGAPLLDHSGRKIGILVVMSDRPIDPTRAPRALVEIFAARAASELERLRLERQLVHAQRLEAMGRLAASVAHDFNNLITVIRASAEFVEAELPAGSDVRELLAPVHDASRRAARLTRQLLTFSRGQPTEPRAVDLRREATGVLALLDHLLGGRVALRTRLDATWSVRIDPGQLEQLIVNLAVNARDASPVGGTIEITAADREVDAERAASHGIAPGAFVQLTVTDEGAGMDETTRARCFEPFFSTKGERGTGLGLATCHGIVHQAGGTIWVESAVGRGTTVHVLLPRHGDPAERETFRMPPG
jgi:signal transduction histidine kinase